MFNLFWLTSSYKLESLADNAVLDITSLVNYGSFTQETSYNVTAFFYGHFIHDDAIGQLYFLFHLTVGTNSWVLERGFAWDVTTFTYETFRTNLEKIFWKIKKNNSKCFCCYIVWRTVTTLTWAFGWIWAPLWIRGCSLPGATDGMSFVICRFNSQ